MNKSQLELHDFVPSVVKYNISLHNTKLVLYVNENNTIDSFNDLKHNYNWILHAPYLGIEILTPYTTFQPDMADIQLKLLTTPKKGISILVFFGHLPFVDVNAMKIKHNSA